MSIWNKIKKFFTEREEPPSAATLYEDENYWRAVDPKAYRTDELEPGGSSPSPSASLPEPLKVIFLDLDGVCTSARTGWHNFDPFAVNFLRWICALSGARIVVTSTWRSNQPREFFRQIFGGHLFAGDWKTPCAVSPSDRNSGECRGREIDSWLGLHPEVTDYLIVDDDTDFTAAQLRDHFVRTDPTDGMLFEHMMRIRDYFNITDIQDEIEEIYQHPAMFAANRPPRVENEF